MDTKVGRSLQSKMGINMTMTTFIIVIVITALIVAVGYVMDNE